VLNATPVEVGRRGLHPLRRAHTLTAAEAVRLLAAICTVLAEGIAHNGTGIEANLPTLMRGRQEGTGHRLIPPAYLRHCAAAETTVSPCSVSG